MKRESLKLKDEAWDKLNNLAKQHGATYLGNPSWRTLIRRIAEGEVRLQTQRGRADAQN
jgi:hypothetical protein